MTVVDEIRKKYGIPEDVAVKTFDYISISTSDLLKRVEELRGRLKEFSDTALEEALDINELLALESELEWRIQERESVPSLSNVPTDRVLVIVLDKKYEELPLKELVNAPVSAIAGVSAKDAQLLKKAFGIDTIKELAENKYVKVAQVIVNMAALE